MKDTTIHAFQTGRLYTNSGQRIAWAELQSGHVAMYDADRMVDYVLRIDGTPTNEKVLAAYDGVSHSNPHRRDVPWSEDTKADHFEARALRNDLFIAAVQVGS